MTDMMNDIGKAIQKAALDGALTEDAISQFNEMVKDNAQYVKDIDKLEKDAERQSDVIAAIQRERDDARTVRDELIKRQDDLTEREKKMTELELQAKHEATRVADHRFFIETVFKPAAMRTEVWGSRGGFDQSGYPHSQSVNDNETKTEHDE